MTKEGVLEQEARRQLIFQSLAKRITKKKKAPRLCRAGLVGVGLISWFAMSCFHS